MFKKLKQWRNERKISKANYKLFCENIIEELLEPLYDKEVVKEIKKQIVNNWFDVNPKSENDIIDTICDISVFSINEAENMNYDFEKSMDETIKEISSRKQSPIQKEIWEKWGYDNTKWEKDKNQPKETLYKANYESCRV